MREPDKSGKSTWSRVRAACGPLARDRAGSAFFYTTISLPVLVGFALLAVDGSRMMNLHSHLQHGADGLALAAAGELNEDEDNDSLSRAKLAIEQLIENDQRFGDAGVAVIDDVTGRFLTSLPPVDAITIDAWIAEDDSRRVADLSDDLEDHPRSRDARFVEITVNPQGFTTLMPAAFIGGSDTAAASATAVAGYTKGGCHFTPMMMCNPFEGATPDLYEMADDPTFRRRMIEIRQVGKGNSGGGKPDKDDDKGKGPPGDDNNPDGGPGVGNPNSGFYFPGNFAFLRTSLGDGADALRDALAMVDPGECSIEDGVDTKPGQNMGPVRQGINVRFDMYEGEMAGKETDSNFRPSLNVRKGNSGNFCTATIQSNGSYQGFPRDGAVATEFGGGEGGRIYNGEWDFETYWNVNFNHGADPIDFPNGWDNTDENRPSRYDVYRHEIETMVPADPNDPDSALVPLYTRASAGGETGAPMCYTGGTLADDPDRRVLYAAVVNCNDPTIKPKLKGASKNIPVYAYAKFFLIRPLDDGADTIDVELVDVAAPLTDYQAKHTVQLYR